MLCTRGKRLTKRDSGEVARCRRKWMDEEQEGSESYLVMISAGRNKNTNLLLYYLRELLAARIAEIDYVFLFSGYSCIDCRCFFVVMENKPSRAGNICAPEGHCKTLHAAVSRKFPIVRMTQQDFGIFTKLDGCHKIKKKLLISFGTCTSSLTKSSYLPKTPQTLPHKNYHADQKITCKGSVFIQDRVHVLNGFKDGSQLFTKIVSAFSVFWRFLWRFRPSASLSRTISPSFLFSFLPLPPRQSFVSHCLYPYLFFPRSFPPSFLPSCLSLEPNHFLSSLVA